MLKFALKLKDIEELRRKAVDTFGAINNRKIPFYDIKFNKLGTETDQEYVIMRGLSQRGKPHCCIFKNEGGNLLSYFDPHPTKQYLSQEHYFYTIEDIWKASL